MGWLRMQWQAFKASFATELERATGVPWSEAIRILRRSILPALWERFVGLVVFLGSLSIGVLILWVAWRVFVLLRKVAVPVLLLICTGCEVDQSGLRSDPCATCDGRGVNSIIDAKVVALCLGLAACASESTSTSTDGSPVPGKGPADFDGGGEILQIDADLLEVGSVPDSLLADVPAADTGQADTGMPDTGMPDTGLFEAGPTDTGRADARPFPVEECVDIGGGIGNPCGHGYTDSDWGCLQSVKSVATVPCSIHWAFRVYVADCADCALYGEVKP